MPRLKANDMSTQSNLQGIAKLLSQLAAEHGELFYVVLTYKCCRGSCNNSDVLS